MLDVLRLLNRPIHFKPAMPDNTETEHFTAQGEVTANFRLLDILDAIRLAGSFQGVPSFRNQINVLKLTSVGALRQGATGLTRWAGVNEIKFMPVLG